MPELLSRASSFVLFPASPGYVIAVIALALLHWTVVPRPARRHLLLLVSLLHAIALTGWQLGLLCMLLLFVHWRSLEHGRRPVRLGWTLAVLLGAFVLLKLPVLAAQLVGGRLPVFVPFVAVGGMLALPVGISYCLFRMIHYTVEIHRGRLKAASFADLVLYVIWFPTYRAGPVDRLDRFEGAERVTASDLNSGLLRIIGGLLKKNLVADYLLGSLFGGWLVRASLPFPLGLLLPWYGVAFMLYMDFSGYTDIAIGTSRLLGYRIMENFDYPYLSPSIGEFWRRWHISLHLFVRDYFFYPLFGRATSLRKMLLGVFVSFICSQIWHALTVNFLLLGIYHGLILVLWGLYERWRKKQPGWGTGGIVARALGVLVTFHLVTSAYLFFFWGQPPLGGARRAAI